MGSLPVTALSDAGTGAPGQAEDAADDRLDVSELAQVCAETERYSFLFALGTVPVRGAGGLPANPFAIF